MYEKRKEMKNKPKKANVKYRDRDSYWASVHVENVKLKLKRNNTFHTQRVEETKKKVSQTQKQRSFERICACFSLIFPLSHDISEFLLWKCFRKNIFQAMLCIFTLAFAKSCEFNVRREWEDCTCCISECVLWRFLPILWVNCKWFYDNWSFMTLSHL